MSIDVKQAYKIASDILEEFIIYSCTELSDGWLFAFKNTNGEGMCVPPLKVYKNGEASLHTETAAMYFDGTCSEKGKIIPLEDIADKI